MKAEWTNKDSLSIESTGQKAVLVFEMPNSCAKCRLKRGLFCGENGNSLYDYIHYDDSINDKPSWCPLKPLPKEKTNFTYMGDYEIHEAIGWNACLEEIEK